MLETVSNFKKQKKMSIKDGDKKGQHGQFTTTIADIWKVLIAAYVSMAEKSIDV